ncbi:hypothetical protein LP109_14365 (plasmid) [Moraxella bovis]|uniref:hypothetical protein n=1 Tax=Moraxella bovis TaxID=476 RepID=UPI00222719DD|nr:hypothetical protein [Moraxella bovis]UZA18110.1 hypothetical protein LP109_14365 [Moraxella bovis]
MKDCNKYDFVIDDRFVHRMNRAFIMTFIWLVYISLFFYYVLTSNAWVIDIFGINISTFYLIPIIAIIPTLHEELMMIVNYGINSFKEVCIIGNKIVGKNFINQEIFIENPVIIDWNLYISKTWYMSKNDDIFKVGFIKISKRDKFLLIPYSKNNMSFIKKLQEISNFKQNGRLG